MGAFVPVGEGDDTWPQFGARQKSADQVNDDLSVKGKKSATTRPDSSTPGTATKPEASTKRTEGRTRRKKLRKVRSNSFKKAHNCVTRDSRARFKICSFLCHPNYTKCITVPNVIFVSQQIG